MITTPETIKITQEAYRKAKLFGPVVEKIFGEAYEWYGFLLGKSDDKSHVVRDVILAQNQHVTHAHCSINGADVGRAAEEVRKRNRDYDVSYHIIGWIHNHADFTCFHSGTDENNFMTVANSASLNTEHSERKDFALVEGQAVRETLEDRVVIAGTEDTDGAIEFYFEDDAILSCILRKYNIQSNTPKELALKMLDELLMASRIQVKQPIIVGVCYSIVVNNNEGDEPYTEIAIIEEEVFTKKKRFTTKNIPLEIIQVEDDIVFSDADIEQEIKDKIYFPHTAVEHKMPREQENKPKFSYVELIKRPFNLLRKKINL